MNKLFAILILSTLFLSYSYAEEVEYEVTLNMDFNQLEETGDIKCFYGWQGDNEVIISRKPVSMGKFSPDINPEDIIDIISFEQPCQNINLNFNGTFSAGKSLNLYIYHNVDDLVFDNFQHVMTLSLSSDKNYLKKEKFKAKTNLELAMEISRTGTERIVLSDESGKRTLTSSEVNQIASAIEESSQLIYSVEIRRITE